MTSLQRKGDEEEEEEDWAGGGLWLYKTSAASQLMPQHSAPAKRTDARGRKSSLSIPSRSKE